METMAWYCPRCGEDSPNDTVINLIAPDVEVEFVCPKCEAKFIILINYEEIE